MKKIISLIITVLILLSCFSFTAFGENMEIPDIPVNEFEEYTDIDPVAVITFSDDYKTLYCGNNTYSRFSLYSVYADTDYAVKNEIVFNETQEQEIENVELSANKIGNIIVASIEFADGASLETAFLDNNYLEEYEKMTSGEYDEYVIDFYYPDGNTVTAQKADLFTETEILDFRNFSYQNDFYVYSMSSDHSFGVEQGWLLKYADEYYYIDFKESNITDTYFFDTEHKKLKAHKITDLELLQQIGEAMDKYSSDGYGIFFDDEFTESVSNVFLVFIFGVIPFVIFVLSLIFSIRSKKVYKKLFTALWIISASELVVFAISALLLMK